MYTYPYNMWVSYNGKMTAQVILAYYDHWQNVMGQPSQIANGTLRLPVSPTTPQWQPNRLSTILTGTAPNTNFQLSFDQFIWLTSSSCTLSVSFVAVFALVMQIIG